MNSNETLKNTDKKILKNEITNIVTSNTSVIPCVNLTRATVVENKGPLDTKKLSTTNEESIIEETHLEEDEDDEEYPVKREEVIDHNNNKGTNSIKSSKTDNSRKSKSSLKSEESKVENRNYRTNSMFNDEIQSIKTSIITNDYPSNMNSYDPYDETDSAVHPPTGVTVIHDADYASDTFNPDGELPNLHMEYRHFKKW